MACLQWEWDPVGCFATMGLNGLVKERPRNLLNVIAAEFKTHKAGLREGTKDVIKKGERLAIMGSRL